MKKLFLLMAISGLVFSGCKKNSSSTNNNNPTNPANPNAMKFIINGLTDITIGKKDSMMLAIGIKLESGTQEKVNLSVTGLPANASASFQTESGIPDFATLLTVRSNDAVAGTYPIKVVGSTANSGSKSYDLNLKINGTTSSPTIGCAIEIIGSFTRKYTCTGYNSPGDPMTIDSIAGVKDQASIPNMGPFPKKVTIELNCATKAINIPLQFGIDGFQISGTGSYAKADSIYFNYTIKGNSMPDQTCTAVFKR